MIEKAADISPNAAALLADRADEGIRRQRVKELLDAWMQDESGYDEAVWPEVKRALDENRVTSGECRKPFP